MIVTKLTANNHVKTPIGRLICNMLVKGRTRMGGIDEVAELTFHFIHFPEMLLEISDCENVL